MTTLYRTPPLVEATCEFRFNPGPQWDATFPGLIYGKLREDFPVRRSVAGQNVEATIQVGPEGVHHQLIQLDRMQFLREDETALVQLSPNVVSVHLRNPYPSWQAFLPIISQVLSKYRDVVDPKGLQRVGLRYVNRFDFDEDRLTLEHYFDFYPYLGERMPQDNFSFITGVQVAFNDERDVLRVQMTTLSGRSTKQVSILLDLDYFLASPGTVNFANVDEWLDEAHTHVEETFEGCLTDNLRKRFEEVSE